jgi:hypothetical protein
MTQHTALAATAILGRVVRIVRIVTARVHALDQRDPTRNRRRSIAGSRGRANHGAARAKARGKPVAHGRKLRMRAHAHTFAENFVSTRAGW